MIEVSTKGPAAKKTTHREIDAKVRQVFACLQTENIEYCLLRGYDELFEPVGYLEIDLLVNSSHLASLAKATEKLGFVELPSWGHKPHYFFVAFDSARGDWIKLDVVTELRYGKPIRRFRIPLAQQCLAERRIEGVPRLTRENEFFTLILHCLLDKGGIRKAHRDRLREIWDGSSETFERKVGILVNRYLAPAITWNQLEAALNSQDWRALEQKATALRGKFARRDPLSICGNVATRVMRRMRPLYFALRKRGHSLALLAPDGGGKSTLASALIRDRILKGRLIYMGTNVKATNIGLPTTPWLHKKRKAIRGKGGALNPFHLGLKAAYFVNNLLEQWLRSITANYHLLRGRFVIFDRFVYDSWVNKKPKTLLKKIRRLMIEAWLPEPDLVIFLDAPGKLLFERKGEHSPDWLEEQRQSYHKLKERIPQMHIVNAAQDAETVRRDVIELVWSHRASHRKKPKH